MIAVVLLALVAIAAVVAVAFARPIVGFRRTLVGRRVLVNTKTDRALHGYLYAARGPLLVLKDVELLEPGADPVKIDGEVVLERDVVDFVQVFPTSKG